MFATICIKKTGELAGSKLNGTCSSEDKRNDLSEIIENSRQVNNKSDDSYMSTIKIPYEKILATVNYFLAKFDAWKKSQIELVVKVNTNTINRRSGRSHRSRSTAKSLSSKSNDGGDPEPAPLALFLPAHEITPALAIHVEFAAPAFSGGTQ